MIKTISATPEETARDTLRTLSGRNALDEIHWKRVASDANRSSLTVIVVIISADLLLLRAFESAGECPRVSESI